MEVFLLLQEIYSILPYTEFTQIRTLISNRSLFYNTQLQQDVNTYFEQQQDIQASQVQLLGVLKNIIDNTRNDHKYESTVVAIADYFDFLQQVEDQLLDPFGFRMFVKDCFDATQQLVTRDTIMDNIGKVKERMEPPQQKLLDNILQQHNIRLMDQSDNVIESSDNMQEMKEDQQENELSPSMASQYQFEPGIEVLMQQAYDILHKDPLLCQQFTGILDSGQMNDGPFIDTILTIYQWILSVDASLWDPLATVLEQMQTLQESTSNQYESYEDFVQRNFLDGGGQEYLDGEIEQARLQHLFDNFTI